MIDEKLIILGGGNYEKSVDVLDLSDLSWSKVIIETFSEKTV